MFTASGWATVAAITSILAAGYSWAKEYKTSKETEKLAEHQYGLIPEAIAEREAIGEEKKARASTQYGQTGDKASAMVTSTIGTAYSKGENLTASANLVSSRIGSELKSSIDAITASARADSQVRSAKLGTILSGVEDKTLMDIAELKGRKSELEAELGMEITDIT
jgi:hypothetical protein